MHEQDLAIVRALVPVAWADGHFAEPEREMMDALLEAYGASSNEKAAVFAYANQQRSLEDINLQELSAADRRVVLQHAVLLSFVDGHQGEAELAFLVKLADVLKIAAAERDAIFSAGAERAKQYLALL
jgi:uncharacterized membrane protein YebE (DUF533 family)